MAEVFSGIYKAPDSGDELRDDGSPCCSCDAHFKSQNEYEVEDDIKNGSHHEEDERSFAVAQSPQDGSDSVVEDKSAASPE